MAVDYERFRIRDYRHWTVYLHENQYFLGRVYIWSKRPGLIDVMDTASSEWEELQIIGNEVKSGLTRIFAPDLFNWASLGNLSRQCHLHVIPRYETPRVFSGVTFTDGRWGKNYAPYDYDFKVDEQTLFEIRDAIAAKL